METSLDRNKAIALLTRSPHGDLSAYLTHGQGFALHDAGFFSHLIAWNHMHGSVRDAQVALPVVYLGTRQADAELNENAAAHILSLPIRDQVRAWEFGRTIPHLNRSSFDRLIQLGLRDLEGSASKLERVATLHRDSLKRLYALTHLKPSPFAQKLLFSKDKTARQRMVAGLADMSAEAAAQMIVKERIPFLVARGALGKRFSEPAMVQAMIEVMTPSELAANAKSFSKLIGNDLALKGAWAEALGRTAASKAPVMRLHKAAEALAGTSAGEKIKGAFERNLGSAKIDGRWLLVVDISGSMNQSIEVAAFVTKWLTKMVKEPVVLAFTNTMVQGLVVKPNIDDATIDQLMTRVRASGGTSLGVALQWAMAQELEVDGIVLISDGADHGHGEGLFVNAYKTLTNKLNKEAPIYFYQLKGEPDNIGLACEKAGYPIQRFDLRGGVDYYSLPNLLQTMRVNRFSLTDQIFETPLLTLSSVLRHQTAQPVAKEA